MLVTVGVHVVAAVDLVSQVLVHGAGLVVNFDLSQARHPQQQVLVVDEAVVLWQALVVVPHLPVHATEEGPLCELLDIDGLGLRFPTCLARGPLVCREDITRKDREQSWW